jgi:hypothetical protein
MKKSVTMPAAYMWVTCFLDHFSAPLMDLLKCPTLWKKLSTATTFAAFVARNLGGGAECRGREPPFAIAIHPDFCSSRIP